MIGNYVTSGEAEVAQAILRSAGIEAFVQDQVEGGVLPVESDGAILLEVRATDAHLARQILEAPVVDDPDAG